MIKMVKIDKQKCEKLKEIGISTTWKNNVCKVDMPYPINQLLPKEDVNKKLAGLNHAAFYNDKLEQLSNTEELEDFIDIWNYSNEWGYDDTVYGMEAAVDGLNSFLNRQLNDFKDQ